MLLEAAFHHYYRIELDRVLYKRTFRWFEVRVAYLLSDDNPFSRKILPPPPVPEPPSFNL